MASAFGHAFAAVMIGKSADVLRESPAKIPFKFWLLTVVSAILPDADAIGFNFGIPYEHMLGHRGLTHSIAFAIVYAVAITYLFFREGEVVKHLKTLALYFFLVTISHAFLDGFTTGGMGVGYFIPFSGERYFFPWRPIKVSPISITRFFTPRGIAVLQSEAIYVGIPFTLLHLFVRILVGKPEKRRA